MEEGDEKEVALAKVRLLGGLWPPVIGAITGVFIAYLTLKGTESGADAKVLESVIGRVSYLETALERRDAEIMSLNFKILELKAENLENYSKLELFQEYINTLPFPAWIKGYDPSRDEFVMVMINYAYSSQFGISKQRYEGSTDREAGWDDEAAMVFEENDRAVLQSKGYIKKKEMFPETVNSTVLVEYTVWKFSIRLGGEKVGVGGMITD